MRRAGTAWRSGQGSWPAFGGPKGRWSPAAVPGSLPAAERHFWMPPGGTGDRRCAPPGGASPATATTARRSATSRPTPAWTPRWSSSSSAPSGSSSTRPRCRRSRSRSCPRCPSAGSRPTPGLRLARLLMGWLEEDDAREATGRTHPLGGNRAGRRRDGARHHRRPAHRSRPPPRWRSSRRARRAARLAVPRRGLDALRRCPWSRSPPWPPTTSPRGSPRLPAAPVGAARARGQTRRKRRRLIPDPSAETATLAPSRIATSSPK